MSGAVTTRAEKDDRLSLRISARVKTTIQEGAALAGVDQTALIIAAAQEAAIKQIEAQRRTELTSIDTTGFVAALDDPPAPTARARAAFERYRRDTRSR